MRSKGEMESFRSRLLTATTKHLDLLMDSSGKVAALHGKSSDAMTAFAFCLTYQMTGNQKYRTAALELADRILADMKATKHGVLYIKQKTKDSGESIAGGGPPAFGWYTAYAAYVYHKEGGRKDDLKYIATVLDQFPWSENGWWPNAIDINTGESKEPLDKPAIINKTVSIAMAAGMVSGYVKNIDPSLSASLKRKADKCIYDRIIPAQEADGYWHYVLDGSDQKNKDVLGYFMITASSMLQLQRFTDSYRDPAFQAALDKAYAFALNQIAPMTDPNSGPAAKWATPGTPTHFTRGDDVKRGFSLGLVLFGGKHFKEGVKIIDYWMQNFPYGSTGEEGGHAVYPSALMLYLLQQETG